MFPHKRTFSSIGEPSSLAQTTMPLMTENQWMSQIAYQNIDSTTVDWAALAQQWIHNRETSGPVATDDNFPIAPPPPRISQPRTDYSTEEQGEAPMEVEHDDEPIYLPPDDSNSIPATAPPPPTNLFQTNNWTNNSDSSRSQSHQKPWGNKSKALSFKKKSRKIL